MPTYWSTEICFVPLKYTDNHQMQVVMSHDEPKPITSSHKQLLNNNMYRRRTESFTQALNPIMARLKLKYAININLTTLDVTYNPINITDKKKLRRNSYFQEKT